VSGLDELQIVMVQTHVCRAFGVERTDLLSARRSRHIAIPRQIAYWVAREATTKTVNQIARAFNRDHSTIMYGWDRAMDIMQRNPEIAEKATRLRQELRERFMGVLA
jgi:chromosomal replication initiator protein